MFRIAEKLPSLRNRCLRNDFTSFKNGNIYLRNSVRHYDSLPPPQKKRGFTKFLLFAVGQTALISGSAIAYAKYDPSFRRKLEEYVPGTDKLIKFVFQEEKPSSSTKPSLTSTLESKLSTVSKLMEKSGKNEDPKTSVPPPPPLVKTAPKPEPESAPQKSKPKPVNPPKSEEKPKERKVNQDPIVKEQPKSKKSQDFQKYDISKLEIKTINAANKAIATFNSAIAHLKEYREDVTDLIEKSVKKDDHTIWFKIQEKTEQKDKLLEMAEKKAQKAMKRIEHLKLLINDSKLGLEDERKQQMQETIKNTLNDLILSQALFSQEMADSSVTHKFSKKVEESRQTLSRELGIFFPSMIVDSGVTVTDEELDLFVLYTCQLLKFYQKELKKLETIGESKIQKIIEQSKAGNPAVIREVVEAETEKLKREFAQDLLKQELNLKIEFENELNINMRRQAEIHNDILREMITLKDKEAERKLKQAVTQKLDEIKINYDLQLAKVVGRMKGLDDALNAKKIAEKQAKRSQLLWNASQSLLLAIKAATSEKPWEEQLKPLEDEVNAISKAAADDDELVKVVVASISPTARTRGVFPEQALRDRFRNVEKVAFRLANVKEGYATIGSILYSYFQSFLIIKSANPMPQAELNDEPVDLTRLNNYDILNRARYWLERDDLLQALKYMHLLRGAARMIAHEWMEEARLFLETQQVANLLLSHAAYSSFVYFQGSS